MRNSWESNDEIVDRIIKEAKYIVSNKCTVRAAAKRFGISKSTVHLDCIGRLEILNELHNNKYSQLSADVKKVIKHNGEIKHLNGGESTRKRAAMRKKMGV